MTPPAPETARTCEHVRIVSWVEDGDGDRMWMCEDCHQAFGPRGIEYGPLNRPTAAERAQSGGSPMNAPETARESRTEAGREYIAAVSADTWFRQGRLEWARRFVLAIEAEAGAGSGEAAGLREALDNFESWRLDHEAICPLVDRGPAAPTGAASTGIDVEAGDYIEDDPVAWKAFVETLRRYHDHLNALQGQFGDAAYEIAAGAFLGYLADQHSVFVRSAAPAPETAAVDR